MSTRRPTSDPGYRQRIPLYPSQFICATVMVSMGPLLDAMMRDLGVPLSRGELISGGFFLGAVLGIVVLNGGMAGVPAKWALLGGMALQGAGLVAAGALSRNLWSLFAAYLVAGFGGVFVNAIGWMWLPAHIKKHMAAAALLMISFFALGMVATPIVLGLAMDRGASWRWILVIEGVISFVAALVFIGLPLLDIPGRRNVRGTHLKQVVAHDRTLLTGIVGATFVYVGAETAFNVWLPKFQMDVFAAGDTWASLAVTLFWIGLIVGRLIIMPLTRRFSPARLLLICACTLAVMAIAVAYAPSQTVSLVLSVGAGLGASASYGIIGSYVGRFPGWQAGVASSMFVIAGSVGSLVFPYIFGALASAAGFRFALAATAAPAAALALLSFVMHTRSGEEGRLRPAESAGRGG